jgi:peptidoglycan/LPS O-acetylase OafA/YrhL
MNVIGNSHRQSRVFGLDLLRALAIALVFVGHGLAAYAPEYRIWIYRLLPDGVSLFFCLSGYLITIAFFDHIKKWGAQRTAIFHFWLKRAVRTVPPFLIALLLYTMLIKLLEPASAPPVSVWSFAFLQNFAWPLVGGFPEGWSLSVEEWYYALFMVLVGLALTYRTSLLTTFGSAALILIIVTLTYRTLVYLGGVTVGDIATVPVWSSYIQTTALGRLDAPAIGVLFAVSFRAWPHVWNSAAIKALCLFSGLIAVWGLQNITVLLMSPDGKISASWFFYFQPTLVALAWSLLLIPASSMQPPRMRVLDLLVRQTAASAFSIYLTHLSIVIVLIVPALISQFPDLPAGPAAAYCGIGVALSQLFYVLVERPALRARRRIDGYFKTLQTD